MSLLPALRPQCSKPGHVHSSFKRKFICLFIFILTTLSLIFFILTALSLCCCERAFTSCGERGYSLVGLHGLLIAVASRCRTQALGCWGSGVVAHRLSCLVARAVFSDQESNPCPLHCHISFLCVAIL